MIGIFAEAHPWARVNHLLATERSKVLCKSPSKFSYDRKHGQEVYRADIGRAAWVRAPVARPSLCRAAARPPLQAPTCRAAAAAAAAAAADVAAPLGAVNLCLAR